MKVIPLSKAKANLSQYGKLCQKEPVVVTVHGVPAFQLVPLKEGDDLIDSLLANNAGFRKLLRQRLKQSSVSVADAKKRL